MYAKNVSLRKRVQRRLELYIVLRASETLSPGTNRNAGQEGKGSRAQKKTKEKPQFSKLSCFVTSTPAALLSGVLHRLRS
jgi:hypothetical protein